MREGRRGHVQRLEYLILQEIFPRPASQPLADVRSQVVHQVAVDEAVAKLELCFEKSDFAETDVSKGRH